MPSLYRPNACEGKLDSESTAPNSKKGFNMIRHLRLLSVLGIIPFIVPPLYANQGSGKTATPPASASGLAGLSYAAGDWNTVIPTDNKRVILCYRLVPTNSASQPFTLEPTDFYRDDPDPTVRQVWDDTKKSPCSKVDNTHPLLERQILVVAIDARTPDHDHTPVNTARMTVLNINLTTQAGSPLNPAPVRPSFSTASITAVNLGPSIYYLRWPIQLLGDTVPTLNVNTVYVAPAPGDLWSPNTVYAAGGIVTPVPSNGHFYTAVNEGRSGATSPTFSVAAPATVADPPAAGATSLEWSDLGSTAPIGTSSPFALWASNKQFNQGTVIANPLNGHFYGASVGGQSGAQMPAFPVTAPATVVEPAVGGAPPLTWTDLGTSAPVGTSAPFATWAPRTDFAQGKVIANPLNGHFYAATIGGRTGSSLPPFSVTPPATVTEPKPGPITWTDLGTSPPAGLPTALPQWTPNTTFTQGQAISNPVNGHFYAASIGGQSGATIPPFPVTVKPPIADGSIIWLDAGTAPPGSVSSAGPTDQVISLLNLPLPQVHSLYYFNLATGVAVSSIRNPTFVRLQQTPTASTSTPQYFTQKVPGNLGVEPILLFTTYLPKFAMDAESPWKPKNLVPGFSFGFSLSAPASSFYFGGSSEIWRHFQVAAGLNVAKVNALAPSGFVDPSSNAAPATVQRFSKGAFVGVTLNIDFIAGLFGQKI
jgi:hypothetical protein